jgi:hypothetical protein
VSSGAPREAAHAYALVPDPEHAGKYLAVHLEGVIAEKAEVLQPSTRGEYPATAQLRVENAMHARTRRQKWNT